MDASIAVANNGDPMKGSPAMRAERTSLKGRGMEETGSTAVTIGSIVNAVCVVAYCKDVYQSLKNALISTNISDRFRCIPLNLLNIVLKIYRTCGAIFGSRSGANAAL